jgi:hypothetical protein
MATPIVVAGIKLDIYGLEEYRARKQNDPVSVLFSMHGRLGKYRQPTGTLARAATELAVIQQGRLKE